MSTLRQTLQHMIGKPAAWDAKDQSLWALGTSRSTSTLYEVGTDYIKMRCQTDPVRYVYIPFNSIQAIYLDH